MLVLAYVLAVCGLGFSYDICFFVVMLVGSLPSGFVLLLR